jgi:hypothetical protein
LADFRISSASPQAAFDERQAAHVGADAAFEHLDAISRDAVFDAVRQQHAVGTIRIHHVFGGGNADRHGRAETLGDFP